MFSDISEDVVSKEEQERTEANKKELDKFLGAYPYERWHSHNTFSSL